MFSETLRYATVSLEITVYSTVPSAIPDHATARSDIPKVLRDPAVADENLQCLKINVRL